MYPVYMGDSTRDNFKANLKYYRKKKGLSQEKLSELIGFGGTYITEIESRHKFPKPETIDLIAMKLGIEPYMLFVQPDQREREGCGTNQSGMKSFAEILSCRFGEMLHDRMPEMISDIMEQEKLLLVQDSPLSPATGTSP